MPTTGGACVVGLEDAGHAVTASGVRLAYEAGGFPGAPPMVLSHALGERGASWAPVMPQSAERFGVLALDLRGHGDSDWPGTYSFQLMCDDVMGVLDQFGLGKVTMIGHFTSCSAAPIAGPTPGRARCVGPGRCVGVGLTENVVQLGCHDSNFYSIIYT